MPLDVDTMQNFKGKNTKWVVSDKAFRVESGIAIAINILENGTEFNREVLTEGDIVTNADSVFCLTDCTFLAVSGEYSISSKQHFNLCQLDAIREEKLVSIRLKEFFKHLVNQYSPQSNSESHWIPLPFQLSQEQIAEFISSARVTVTRSIKDLVDAGFVKKEKRKLFVNIDTLKD